MASSDVHQDFLSPLIPSAAAVADSTRSLPFVTLTYAQSLDARIAGKDSKQLILSGKESMKMTHRLRTMHNGILIGVSTVVSDNPQLNARYLPPSATPYPQPEPIILDPSCRIPLHAKLFSNYKNGIGRKPVIIFDAKKASFKAIEAVMAAGGETIALETESDGRFSLVKLLKLLRLRGIKTLMVEGGSNIISSFLTSSPLVVDLLLITIAPTLVGEEGVAVTQSNLERPMPEVEHIATTILDRDVVMACKLK